MALVFLYSDGEQTNVDNQGKSLKTPVKQVRPLPPKRILIILVFVIQNVENSAVDNILHLFKHVQLCIKV